MKVEDGRLKVMSFALVCIVAIVALGIVAAIASRLQGGSDEVHEAHDCASCSAVASGECKIGCLLEEKKRAEAAAEMEKNGAKDNKKEV